MMIMEVIFIPAGNKFPGWTRSVGLGFHVGAQDGVDAGLVAFAVLFEPLHDVVVHADGEAVFGLRQGELGGGPERFAELGDVGEIDFGIPQGARGEAMNRLRELSAKKYLQPKSTDRSGGCASLAVHIPARNFLSSPPKNGPFHFLTQAHNPVPQPAFLARICGSRRRYDSSKLSA